AVAFTLVPLALAGFCDGRLIRGLDGGRFAKALCGVLLVVSVLVSWKFGAIVDNGSFKGGFSRITRKLTDAQRDAYRWIDDQTRQIPRRASVAATPKMGPHVSNRKNAYLYPEKRDTDYVFIDETELKGPELERHKALIDEGKLVELSRN